MPKSAPPPTPPPEGPVPDGCAIDVLDSSVFLARFRGGTARRVGLATLLSGLLTGIIVDFSPGRLHQKERFLRKHAVLLCVIERVSGEAIEIPESGDDETRLATLAASISRLWRRFLGPTTAYLVAPLGQPAYQQMPVLAVSKLSKTRTLDDLGIVLATRNMAIKTATETLAVNDPDAHAALVLALCDGPSRQHVANNAAGTRTLHPSVLPLWDGDLSKTFQVLMDWYADDAPDSAYSQTGFGTYADVAGPAQDLADMQRHVTWLIPLDGGSKTVSRLSLRFPVDDQARPDRVLIEDGVLVVRGMALAKPIVADFKEAGTLTGDLCLPFRPEMKAKDGSVKNGYAAILGASDFSVGKAGELIYGSHDGGAFLVHPSPAAAFTLAKRDPFGDFGRPSHLYFFGLRTDNGKTLSEHGLVVPAPLTGGQVYIEGEEADEATRMRLLAEAVRAMTVQVEKVQDNLRIALTILLRESVRGEAEAGKKVIDVPKPFLARRNALVGKVDAQAVALLGDAVASAPMAGDAAKWKDNLIRAWTTTLYDVADAVLERAIAELAVRTGMQARTAAAMAAVSFARSRLKAETGNSKPSAAEILTTARSTVNQITKTALERATRSATVLSRALNDISGGVVFDNQTRYNIMRATPEDLPMAYWRLVALAELPADDEPEIVPLWLAIMRGMATIHHARNSEERAPGFGAALCYCRYPAARIDALVGGDAARMTGEIDAVTSFLKTEKRQFADWSVVLALGVAVAENDAAAVEAVRDHIVRDYALAEAGIYAKRKKVAQVA